MNNKKDAKRTTPTKEPALISTDGHRAPAPIGDAFSGAWQRMTRT